MSDWTTPKTWVVDELVTAPLLNTHLRDNLGYLFARPGAQVKLISGAAYLRRAGSMAAAAGTRTRWPTPPALPP